MKSAKELGQILFKMYTNAPRKEQVTMIHLFGIQYYEAIQQIGVKEVIEEAGMLSSYKTELSKAIKLAKYVRPIQTNKK